MRYIDDMTTDQTSKVEKLVNRIVAEYVPEKVILFGSQVWGEPNAGSDIDLLVIKDTVASRLERGREIERIIMGSGIPVDALVFTPQEVEERLEFDDFFITDIVNNGKVLYE